jgi:phosphoglycerate dehydrogenase-like enzyme
MKVLLLGRFPGFVVREVRKRVRAVHLEAFDAKKPGGEISEAEVIVITGVTKFNKKILGRAKSLKTLITFSHGFEHVDVKALKAKGITFRTVPGSTPSVAELTFGLMISLLRKIPEHDRWMKKGGWKSGEGEFGRELYGKTLGVIGLGPIGKEVCRIAKAFGMKVVACDPNRLTNGKRGVKTTTLERLLEVSDVVSLHVHLDEKTRHMIGRKQLRKMKKSAVLINTARGGLVDSEALYKTLRSGRIAGAGLDVFEKEPPGRDRLVGLPNVVSTPHAGADTIEGEERKVGMLLDMLRKTR